MKILLSLLLAAALVTALVDPVPAQTGGSAGRPSLGSELPHFTLPDMAGRQVSLDLRAEYASYGHVEERIGNLDAGSVSLHGPLVSLRVVWWSVPRSWDAAP